MSLTLRLSGIVLGGAFGLVGGCGANVPPGAKDGAAVHAPFDAAEGGAALCNSAMGRTIPVPLCTTTNPCDKPLPLLPQTPITEPTFVPACATSRMGRPIFDDGVALAFTPQGGTPRYACRFQHPDASPASKRPLVIWIPGSGGSAADTYNLTLLREKAVAYDVSGDPARPGYHLLSVQPRNLRWMTANPQDGPKHDFFHRDLTSPSTNTDIANLDRLIDDAIATGNGDPARVYVMGWSNGAQFAQLYAIARHETATPGGNHVAAAAIFSGADPFDDQPDRPTPSCRLEPYPHSSVPILVVSRACDAYPCDAAQGADLASEGLDVNPGAIVADWMTDLATKVGDPNAQWLVISGIGTVATTCTSPVDCTKNIAVGNHIRWPDGTTLADGGREHERAMLDFLRAHPHP